MMHARTPLSRPSSGAASRRPAAPRGARRGQSLVEFTLLLPLLLTLAVGLLEFGMLFKDHLGINYASRAGARVGVEASKRTDADCFILSAISTTLSTMNYDRFVRAEIYRANTSDGTCSSPCLRNVWVRTTYQQPECVNQAPGAGWAPYGALSYQPSVRQNVDDRNQNLVPDGLGVEVQYMHDFFFNYVPGANTTSVVVKDRTVMQIEPPEFRPVPP